MDPISQGTLGAALAQAGSRGASKLKAATLLGCLGGLAPDLDVLIFSPTDPLLFLEYHRQFTHSLAFIPIGALVVAALAHRLAARQLSFKEAYLYCLLGYATHGLLDACTTYGTVLLWPFSSQRFAWNNVSIIDPILTLPMLALVIIGVRRRSPRFAIAALLWAACYLALGVVQRDRALAAGTELAASRGHTPIRLEAKPGFANLILWKTVYETERRFHIDAIRVAAAIQVFPGDQAPKLAVQEHFPWLDPNSQQAKDLARFHWFSNGYLALDKQAEGRIVDIRYSVVPNEIAPLWSIELAEGKPPSAHASWRSLRRATPAQATRLWKMLWASSPPPECCQEQPGTRAESAGRRTR